MGLSLSEDGGRHARFAVVVVVRPLELDHSLGPEVDDKGPARLVGLVTARVMQRSPSMDSAASSL